MARPDESRGPLYRHVADGTRVLLTAGAIAQLIVAGLDAALNPLAATTVAWAVRPARAAPGADALFVVLLAMDALLTTTGAMKKFDVKDTFGHLTLSAAIAPIFLSAGQFAGVLRPRSQHPLGLIAVLAVAIMALGVAWEIVEWLADSWLDTNMALGYTDTVHDLACDALGATCGSILAVALSRKRPQRRDERSARMRSATRPRA